MDDYASSLFFVCFFCQSWHRFLSNLVIIFFMAKVAALANEKNRKFLPMFDLNPFPIFS